MAAIYRKYLQFSPSLHDITSDITSGVKLAYSFSVHIALIGLASLLLFVLSVYWCE